MIRVVVLLIVRGRSPELVVNSAYKRHFSGLTATIFTYCCGQFSQRLVIEYDDVVHTTSRPRSDCAEPPPLRQVEQRGLFFRRGLVCEQLLPRIGHRLLSCPGQLRNNGAT